MGDTVTEKIELKRGARPERGSSEFRPATIFRGVSEKVPERGKGMKDERRVREDRPRLGD